MTIFDPLFFLISVGGLSALAVAIWIHQSMESGKIKKWRKLAGTAMASCLIVFMALGGISAYTVVAPAWSVVVDLGRDSGNTPVSITATDTDGKHSPAKSPQEFRTDSYDAAIYTDLLPHEIEELVSEIDSETVVIVIDTQEPISFQHSN